VFAFIFTEVARLMD